MCGWGQIRYMMGGAVTHAQGVVSFQFLRSALVRLFVCVCMLVPGLASVRLALPVAQRIWIAFFLYTCRLHSLLVSGAKNQRRNK